MMNSICSRCAMAESCFIDASANIQRCILFSPKIDYGELFDAYIDQIAERVADKVVERMKDEQKITLQVDGLQQHAESGQDHSNADGVVQTGCGNGPLPV